jgi:hypothetical protein
MQEIIQIRNTGLPQPVAETQPLLRKHGYMTPVKNFPLHHSFCEIFLQWLVLSLSCELCDLQENPRVIAKGATKWDTKGRCTTPSL